MPSALPGDICVGEHSVCVVRAALLDPDCTPKGGADSGMITTGIISATASPEFVDGASFEPLTGCGRIAWAYETRAQVRRWNISGELTYFDHEAMSILFGGQLVVGDAGTAFAGDNIGWASPFYTDTEVADQIYIEFITLTAGEGVGSCGNEGAPFPAAIGHIFPKTSLNMGERTMEFDAATLSFEGFSVNNPNIGDGPWNDWPGVGSIPNSGYTRVSYGQAEYDAILDLAACGFQSTFT